jgi:hypothetical protein
MKIHLLRSPELKEETYRNVFNLLSQFRGPFEFVASEDESSFEDFDHDFGSPSFFKRFEAFKLNHPDRAEKKERTLFDEFKKNCPNQFYNCGVAENNMVGVAAGLA